MFILNVIPVYLLQSANGRILPSSPCPSVYHYEPMDGSESNYKPFKGVITVTSSMPIFLKVKLQIPAALTTEYRGRLLLAETAPVVNFPHLNRAKYEIYYPKDLPLPLIVLIQANNNILCLTNPVRRRIKTTVVWEHSSRPNPAAYAGQGGIMNYNQFGSEGDFGVQRRLQLSENPFRNRYKSCGKSKKELPFKVDGTPANRGDWPWMVPLFKKTELGMQFICSSTLISHQFVLTAAHCLKGVEKDTLDKDDLIAYVGKFNIKNWIEDNTQPREISEIYVHPDYDVDTLYSDLALLKLKQKVRTDQFVNLACIWEEEDDLNLITDKKGIISGWGMDEAGHKLSDTPNIAVMPIVSQEECLRSKVEFVFLTSNRTFCAGFRDGTGPCSGDSGGGLFLLRKDQYGDTRWFLRGTVSLSLVQQNMHPVKCDLYEFTIFTDIAKFRTWLFGLTSNLTFYQYDFL